MGIRHSHVAGGANDPTKEVSRDRWNQDHLIDGELLLGGLATDPVAPVDGAIWLNTTTGEIKFRSNGATVVPDSQRFPITDAAPTTATLIANAALIKTSAVPLRAIMGRNYTTATDGAAVLNAAIADLSAAGLAITDPDNMAVSVGSVINLQSNMQLLLGPNTTFIRTWAGVGTGQPMFYHTNHAAGGAISNVRWRGGRIAAYDPGITGVVFRFFADASVFSGLRIDGYRSGQAFLFGGTDLILSDIKAVSDDTNTGGDGAFRMLRGNRVTVFGCTAICSDDCFQFVPNTGVASGPLFGLSIVDSQYVGCHGLSRNARLCIAAVAAGSGPQTPSRLQRLTFSSVKGSAPQGIVVACDTGDGTVDQVDDISFLQVNLQGVGTPADLGSTSSSVWGDAVYDRAVGRVNFTNCTVEGATKDYGLDLNAKGGRVTIQSSFFAGDTNALRIRAPNMTVRTNASVFSTQSGAGAGRQPILVTPAATNLRLAIEGMVARGVPTGLPAIQVSGVGSFVDLRSLQVERATAATDVRAVQGVSGVSMYLNRESLSGDIDNTTVGSISAFTRITSNSNVPFGAAIVNNTATATFLLSELGQFVVDDSAIPGARTHSISLTGAAKGDRIRWYRGVTSAGVLTVRSAGGANLADLTAAGQWVDVLFDGTAWVAIGQWPPIFPASIASSPAMRIPHGVAPTTPTDGDIWTTTAGLFVRINGVTVGPLT
jgi:hypothetical protein